MPDNAAQSPDSSAPAWSNADLASNPHTRADKPQRVRGMFAAIAHAYDLNNRLHSLGMDQLWRRAAVRAVKPTPSDHLLDVACGTGDLTLAFARANIASAVGLDFTQEMLDIAEIKRRDAERATKSAVVKNLKFIQGDAMALPFPDASFDILSIAFGIRNVADPAKAIREFFRVLRPNGRLVVLEFDKPRFAPIRWTSDFYTNKIMPLTATLISKDRSGAYKYLPKSVETFLNRDQLAQVLRDCGFDTIHQKPLSFGVCVCTTARKP
ncbi:MAG: bifunctional demethylmenaquinone methyltransferase/2-methoxy-6-polyprenyl-1,4-benzoquinol methylase UbiE [Phycisphaerales bacterium]|nr:bifunctional demethylmenaquinone methyltransferase/2-methoxy-6-polyprenyl-1,4-benzoquinol methylase UbiE [Phycisphaerales bacterium]